MKPDIEVSPLLEHVGQLFTKARENIFEGISGLHEIFDKELWKGAYETFGNYCEAVCQLNPSQASRYLKVYRHYVLSGSFSTLNLTDTDPDKLYLAIGTKGDPKEQYARASTLTRGELKQELAEKDGEACAHEEKITICARCHVRIP